MHFHLELNEAIWSAIAGSLLAIGYFCGLWWTVRRLPKSSHPFQLLLVSSLIRTALVLAGFYLVMNGHWERLVVCLAGFMLTRLVCVRWIGMRQHPAPSGQSADLAAGTEPPAAVWR